ncbi:uncharacterized protein [Venturia canescens]|uniref:uncharacterized protein n=1 Tax=Venturia canescens TaxID=32260 RepID=UPI001C9C5486|nr:uncharacterized protein LOC122414390 [Venturia canescens]XP_043282189.1 uncharacterized protein LOC122414707 [Venturia canescens]
MSVLDDRPRDKFGKFTTKKKLQWKENIVIANKRRKIISERANDLIVDGRRIVEIKRLAEDMWCSTCDAPLSFRYIEDEKIIGLASIFYVRCQLCLLLLEVRTSKGHKQDNYTHFDINVKNSLAMIDAGVGISQLNSIFSALNIPIVSGTLVKRNERHVGKALEKLARETCREAVKLERELTQTTTLSSDQQPSYQSEQDVVPLKVSFDTGWQKKGSGRSYNSLTGHGIAVGSKSGKVLAYGTKNKRCIRCEKGHKPSDHDCRLNHTGSSKSMEGAIAVEILAKNSMFVEEGVVIGTLIGDDDSSTIAQVRRESDHPVEKESDKNHAVCTLSKNMWALKIPGKVIEYIKYCFGCVLIKNKGNEEAVRRGILNIVPHAFDDHSNCCRSWCGFVDNPENYKHKILPDGKGLTDVNMRASLTAILTKFAANSKRLAPCGSTQANESFHNISLSKTTKRCHYGGSESNDFRVASAVCQKNHGTSYVVEANMKLSLSPGKYTKTHREKKDKMRISRALAATTVEKKRRRRQLHRLRHSKNVVSENKEGITYLSGSGFHSFDDNNNDFTQSNESIPNDSRYAFFDVETTGLSKSSEIVQLSAKIDDREFDAYLVPTCGFAPTASLVTGLSVEEGVLYRNGVKMATKSRTLTIKSFIDFLSPGPVILIAHNGGRFDAPLLIKQVQILGLMDNFLSVVCGFCDTLPLFKKMLPDRVKSKGSFSQTALAEDFIAIGSSAGAHNSMVDVITLENIVKIVGVTEENLRSNAVTVKSIITQEIQAAKTADIKKGLDCLKNGVSIGMLTKIAKAGITIENLTKSLLDGGEDAVVMLLGVDVNGRPRVTKNKRVLQNLIAELKKYP